LPPLVEPVPPGVSVPVPPEPEVSVDVPVPVSPAGCSVPVSVPVVGVDSVVSLGRAFLNFGLSPLGIPGPHPAITELATAIIMSIEKKLFMVFLTLFLKCNSSLNLIIDPRWRGY